MRYAQSQYAQAFIQLVDRYPEHSDALCDGLFRALKHNGDHIKARAVIAAIEKEFMRRDGITSAMVISAHPLSTALRDRLQNAINGNVIVHQRIDPNVVGGAKIIINETMMIDATLARKLKQLFPHASLTV